MKQAVGHFCSRISEDPPGIIVGDFYDPAGAGRVFADCRGLVVQDMDEFERYQDELLSETYYGSPSSVRWNLYLVLVCSQVEYERLVRTGFCATLEEDIRYARKLVIPEDSVDQELVMRFVGPGPGADVLPPDPVGKWTQVLTEAGLAGVTMPRVAMDHVVGKFIEGSPVRPAADKSTPTGGLSGTAPDQLRVESIKTGTYRSCLHQAQLDFGAVNLFSGRNAGGKTSLLEAIELWFCGQTLRNPTDREDDSEIGLRLRGQPKYKWNRNVQPAEYRARALNWYGVYKAKESTLHESFGRFNFFDSDAAARLTHSITRSDVADAFDGLVLGRDAAVLLERARGVRERLRGRLNAAVRARDALELERRRLSESISVAASELSEQTGNWRDVYTAVLSVKGLRSPAQIQEATTLDDVEGGVVALQAAVEAALSHEDAQERLSQGQILSSHEGAEALRRTLVCAEERFREVGDQIASAEQVLALTTQRLGKLKALAPYVENESARLLPNLGERIAAQEMHVQVLREPLRSIEGIEVSAFSEEERSFASAIQDFRTRLARVQAKVRTAKGELEEQQRVLKEAQRLEAVIRSSALQLLHLRPGLATCPLCRAQHGSAELRERLSRALPEEKGDGPAGIVAKIAEGEKEAASLRRELRELETLRGAAWMLVDEVVAEALHVSRFVAMLPQLRGNATRSAAELQAMVSLRDRMRAAGLTEEAYSDLLVWAAEDYPELPTTYDAREQFLACLKDYSKQQRRAKSALSKAREKLRVAKQEAASAMGTAGVTASSTGEGLRRLNARAEWVGLARAAFESASAVFEVPVECTLLDLRVVGTALREAIDAIRVRRGGEAVSGKLLGRLRSQRARCASKLEEARKAVRTIESALGALETVLEADGGGRDAVEAYLRACEGTLNELFSILCWPREFSGVRLVKSGLVAVRRGSGVEAPITKLSSGQRSALALSTFLALNRCVRHGPPLLLFDDPVVFIDDLNALGFFDILRAIVHSEDRQVFYATASAKMASLFCRKFEYLGKDFVHHRLPLSQQ